MYTLYLLIDIVYVYHSSHVNKYEANGKTEMRSMRHCRCCWACCSATLRRRVLVWLVNVRQVWLKDTGGLSTNITVAVPSVVGHDEMPVVIPHLGIVADISFKFFEMNGLV